MRNPLFLFASLLALSGCTGSHVLGTADAGAFSDAAPSDASVTPDAFSPDAFTPPLCRLATPDVDPTSVGAPCFCDGPFAVRGDVAYRLSFMLEVIDLSDADRPTLVASIAHEARYSADVAIVGDVLFAAGGALEPFDLRDPRAPVSLGSVALGGEATALAVDGDQLVVAIRREDSSNALIAIDAADPRALVLGPPFELGTSNASALALSGAIAFAVLSDVETGAATLAAIDLSARTMADALPRGTGGTLSAIIAHAGHVFISDLSDGVSLVDATDPTALVDLGRVELEATSVFSLGLTDDRLIVLGGGAWLYDASNPRALVPMGHADWSSDLGHAELFGDNLLVSGGNALVSLPLACD